MPKSNAEYWRRRFEDMQNRVLKPSEDYSREVEQGFKEALFNIKKDIASWYGRFAENNGISLAEAQKILTKGELEEFRWTLKEYLEAADRAGADPKWIKQLENASARVHISRLASLEMELRQIIELLYADKPEATERILCDTYKDSYTKNAYEVYAATGEEKGIRVPDSNALRLIITQPWTVDDLNFSDRIWRDKDKLIKVLNKELTAGFARGEAYTKVADRAAKAMGESQFNMRRLVHTEGAYFASKGQRDSYEFLGVEEFEVIGTLDDLTCEKCGAMDGKHFPMSEWKIGKTAHPFHPFCRCTTVPYFNDEFTEDEERVARDENGESYYTKAKTFEEWEKECVKEEFTGGENGGIIKIRKGNLFRRTGNNDSFRHLPERMSKKHIRKVATEFNVDITGLEFNIDTSEELLKYNITGEAVPEKIGKITFFPNAFLSKEEIVRTLVHEREHVRQFKDYGVEYVQNNRGKFEDLAYQAENSFIEKLKQEGKL